MLSLTHPSVDSDHAITSFEGCASRKEMALWSLVGKISIITAGKQHAK
jgi:hypothetical protein